MHTNILEKHAVSTFRAEVEKVFIQNMFICVQDYTASQFRTKTTACKNYYAVCSFVNFLCLNLRHLNSKVTDVFKFQVLSHQPHGSSQRICNIQEDKNGGVTIYMSKPQKNHDNINNPKQYEDNYLQLKRQKGCQNVPNHPPEPPKVEPRKTKQNHKEAKAQSKKAYYVESSMPKEQQDCRHISGTSEMNETLPSVQEEQVNIQNYDPDLVKNEDDTQVVISAEGEVRVDNSKLAYKETSLPLSINNKELTAGQYTSVGIQVSPSPQYRLRFLPAGGCSAYNSSEWELCGIKRIQFFLRLIGRWTFSQCGLSVILFIWALLGATAFRATEGPYEEQVARELMARQQELVIELARDLRIIKQEEPGWHNKIGYYVDKHKEMLLEAVSDGYGEGGNKGKIWSYAGCLLFSVSLLTTLGKFGFCFFCILYQGFIYVVPAPFPQYTKRDKS
jgi:hypothetical protein